MDVLLELDKFRDTEREFFPVGYEHFSAGVGRVYGRFRRDGRWKNVDDELVTEDENPLAFFPAS